MLFLFSILLVTDLRFKALENTSCFKSWCIRVSQWEPSLHTQTCSVYQICSPVSDFQKLQSLTYFMFHFMVSLASELVVSHSGAFLLG